MENIGEKIYNLRKEKNVSQEELAEAVDVTRQTVSKWERDVVLPTPQNFKSLCGYFGVALNYFLTDEEVLLIKAKIKETVSSSEEDNEPPETLNELAVVETVTEKEPKFKTLKIISIVVAMTLLALCVIACGIAAYITVAPNEDGAWRDSINSVNFEGIIFLILGILALAIFLTIAVLLLIKRKKRTKNK